MTLTTEQIFNFIPFRHLDRTQVAELLNSSRSTVDRYTTKGVKVCEDFHLYLKKEKNGKFLTTEVISFINKKNKYKSS